MKSYYKTLWITFLSMLVFSACESSQKYNGFPMYEFAEYLPINKGDTIHYEKMNKTDYPFVVQSVNVSYDEGNPMVYDNETAEYSIVATNINSINDTTYLTINFCCYGRTRIIVEYKTSHSSLSIKNTGIYIYSNRSDLLFAEFPKDTLLLTENETNNVNGIVVRNKGLVSFEDANMTYTLK